MAANAAATSAWPTLESSGAPGLRAGSRWTRRGGALGASALGTSSALPLNATFKHFQDTAVIVIGRGRLPCQTRQYSCGCVSVFQNKVKVTFTCVQPASYPNSTPIRLAIIWS